MSADDRRREIAAHIGRDPFAARLGARLEAIEPGHSRVTLTIGDEMTNFHGVAHGGVIFTLADIALAAASNSRGQTALALNVAITFVRPTRPGDHLVAEAQERHVGGPTGLYDVTVRLADSGELVA
ncbi:MAG: hotdog fold thioesterase, partial [Candidatus Binatia bacterium]